MLVDTDWGKIRISINMALKSITVFFSVADRQGLCVCKERESRGREGNGMKCFYVHKCLKLNKSQRSLKDLVKWYHL